MVVSPARLVRKRQPWLPQKGDGLFVDDNDQHGVEIGCDFISRNSEGIAARSKRIAAYANMQIGLAQKRSREVGENVFANPLVTAERARFLLSDPVQWFQASGPACAEIKRVLGVSEEACPKCGSESDLK